MAFFSQSFSFESLQNVSLKKSSNNSYVRLVLISYLF